MCQQVHQLGQRACVELSHSADKRVTQLRIRESLATVTAKNDVRYVTLTYDGGEQNIVIPPTAPVVAFVPGAASLAKPGAPVFVLSDDTNGKITAGLVAVGSDGLTPPF